MKSAIREHGPRDLIHLMEPDAHLRDEEPCFLARNQSMADNPQITLVVVVRDLAATASRHRFVDDFIDGLW